MYERICCYLCMCKYECVRVQTMSLRVHVSGGCIMVGREGLVLNAKSATWSQIGPQPAFISPPSFGNEWD